MLNFGAMATSSTLTVWMHYDSSMMEKLHTQQSNHEYFEREIRKSSHFALMQFHSLPDHRTCLLQIFPYGAILC